MKKILTYIFASAALLLGVSACEYNYHDEVTGVEINKETIELSVGAQEELNATVEPTYAYNRQIKWKSSDPTIAQIIDGKVTGIKAGTAIITVTTVDGGFTDTCTVTVK
jgi:uncharacterized protein YjdB